MTPMIMAEVSPDSNCCAWTRFSTDQSCNGNTTYNVLCDINLALVLLLAVPMAAVNLTGDIC